MSNAIKRLRNALEFLDMVRETPAHERPEGVMRDALRGMEEAAREAVSHPGACVPWRGRDGDLGACIYCGKKLDAITADPSVKP